MSQDVNKQSKKEKQKGDRIAKVMAAAGLCSRRDAERWIAEGRVQVNGNILSTPACVVTQNDEIVVDGKALPQKQKTRLFLYHKPTGQVTTSKDDHGRPTIYDGFPKNTPRLVSVGRLDLNSEGLLLLTTDGALSRYLELPSTALRRHYRVRVFGQINEGRLYALKDGITVDGIRYGSVDVEIEQKYENLTERGGGKNTWLHVGITEGKNREIRNIMRAMRLQVNRLIRVSYGCFELGQLKQGELREVPEQVMKDQLKGFFK